MDSNSDSGGSHISATPPRRRSPPPQRWPLPSLPPSSKSSTWSPNTIPSSSIRQTPIARPKPTAKLKPSKPRIASHPTPSKSINKHSQETDPSTSSSPLLNLPIRIHRPSDQYRSTVTPNHLIETLPAGYFSTSTAFSKLKRSCPRPPDSTENDPGLLSVSISSQCGIETTDAPNPEFSASCNAKFTKTVRKHPNLIWANNISSTPTKRRKSVSEGNFVKLNMKGHKRGRFANKRRGCNMSTGGRAYKRFKVKVKAKPGSDTNDIGDEDGFVPGERFPLRDDGIDEALSAVRNEASNENLLNLLKLTHGYDSFNEGQLEAIKMVLSGHSTMLVLPTGAGKSLCYQLPAMILQGMTLVISPLVSLMNDQLKQLPPMVHGGLLASSQTPEESAETQRLLIGGVIKVLFVSPERFLNAEFSSLTSTIHTSLVVVDEAHCISEWSHNFRPSYMRLKASLLRTRLNASCILAMTATATSRTLHTVMSALDIPPKNLIHSAQLRDNLQLSASFSENRMKDVLKLIKSLPFTELKSIIIYCKFQSETELISKYLYDNNISAKSYHSGIPAKDRRRWQEHFCSNKIRVVVATVAFGMGLDKRDVGAVIHYSLPESLEEYVQEIGRAGRDGRLSYCHLIFDNSTYFKLRSLMHSDGVDEYAVSRFLSQVFSTGINSHGKISWLVIEPASLKFDMKDEVMLTLLTRLELDEVQYLRLLPQLNVTCTLSFHKTPSGLLAEKDIMISTILKMAVSKHGQYIFAIPSIANSIGVTAFDLLNQFQSLKLKGEITYELKDPAYCYTVVDVPDDFCSLAAHLTKWLSDVESSKVKKLDAMLYAVSSSVEECDKKHGCSGAQHTACLQKKILDYFNGDDSKDIPCKMAQSSRFLQADIKVFLKCNFEAKFTPRAVARIMHGIASPAYPAATWSTSHFWGRYTEVDFHAVMEIAKVELMNLVGKDTVAGLG